MLPHEWAEHDIALDVCGALLLDSATPTKVTLTGEQSYPTVITRQRAPEGGGEVDLEAAVFRSMVPGFRMN
jgi:hypothetical protein